MEERGTANDAIDASAPESVHRPSQEHKVVFRIAHDHFVVQLMRGLGNDAGRLSVKRVREIGHHQTQRKGPLQHHAPCHMVRLISEFTGSL